MLAFTALCSIFLHSSSPPCWGDLRDREILDGTPDPFDRFGTFQQPPCAAAAREALFRDDRAAPHLCYRGLRSAGTWSVRCNGWLRKFAVADDFETCNGETVLNYWGALERFTT